MESEGPTENFQVEPKTKFLTAQELLALRKFKGGSLKVGLKKSQSDGSEEETAEIHKLHDELRKHLSRPRIGKSSSRTLAEWDSENQKVKVIKKEGKFQAFGYTESKIDYLENHEALFLMEVNRLELYFECVLVSIEQAYVLLLGEEKSKNYDNYLVYSTLSRTGYILRKYKNIPYNIPVSEEDCIWEFVYSCLDNPNRSLSYVRNSEKYKIVETSIKLHAEKILKPSELKSEIIVEPSCSHDYIDFDRKFPTKRKTNELFKKNVDYKRQRTEGNRESHSSSKSFLDILKNEKEYQEFKDIFEKLEIVQLKTEEEEKENDQEYCREMNIDFDIHLPTKNFKKSNPKPPALRAIILTSSDNFPNRSELVKTYKSQEYKVPLIVVSVSDSKHIQAFLYYFT